MTDQDPQTITYLMLAQLVHGESMIFGIEVEATDFESGLPELYEMLLKDQGQRFIDAKDLQLMLRVEYFQCPGRVRDKECNALVATASPGCPNCNMRFRDTKGVMLPDVVDAIKIGKMRVIQDVKFASKALLEGTSNRYKIRPEHIIYCDLVPPDSPAYKRWAEIARLSHKQIEALRGRDAENEATEDR